MEDATSGAGASGAVESGRGADQDDSSIRVEQPRKKTFDGQDNGEQVHSESVGPGALNRGEVSAGLAESALAAGRGDDTRDGPVPYGVKDAANTVNGRGIGNDDGDPPGVCRRSPRLRERILASTNDQDITPKARLIQGDVAAHASAAADDDDQGGGV